MHLSSPVQAGAEASGVPHRAAAPAYREGHDYAHAYGLRRRAVKACLKPAAAPPKTDAAAAVR